MLIHKKGEVTMNIFFSSLRHPNLIDAVKTSWVDTTLWLDTARIPESFLIQQITKWTLNKGTDAQDSVAKIVLDLKYPISINDLKVPISSLHWTPYLLTSKSKSQWKSTLRYLMAILFILLLWKDTHDVKVTILTILKCTTQWP